MKKQIYKTEQTKQAILEAFCKIHSKKPIERITVQEITKKAGFNRCTFYQYFSDIYEIQDYIENDMLDYLRQKAVKGKKQGLEPLGVLEIAKLYEEKDMYMSVL